MTRSNPTASGIRLRRVSISFLLLLGLLALVAITGGASRFNAPGQMIVRAGVVLELAVWVLLACRPIQVARGPLVIVGLAMLVVVVQLIPLPPALWTALPGSDLLRNAGGVGVAPLPWRPLTIVPSATLNALFSLLVPLAAVLFAGACRPDEQRLVLVAVAGVIGVSSFVELAQFAGNTFFNPLNGPPGSPSGLLANRNHQALLLAIGCVVFPVWATLPDRSPAWRSWMALGCVTLLELMIVATGSRAGLILGLIAILALPVILRVKLSDLRGDDGRRRRLLLAAIVVGGIALMALALWAGRSESFDRLREIDTATDMRTRSLPTVFALLHEYGLIGVGFGSFDPLFRANEPFSLLKPTYFNQAHDDVLEIVILGGIPAAALLLGAIIWIAMRSVRIWRDAPLGRLGMATILLVVAASLFDYPARTPMIMTILAIAAVWLSADPYRKRPRASALTSS